MRFLLLLLAASLLTACPTQEVEERVLLEVTVQPDAVALATGREIQLVAWGQWSDGARLDVTKEAGWFASDPETASVSDYNVSRGHVIALMEGTSTVTATLEMTAGSAVITVGPPELDLLVVTPVRLDLPAGAGQQLTATGWYSVTFSDAPVVVGGETYCLFLSSDDSVRYNADYDGTLGVYEGKYAVYGSEANPYAAGSVYTQKDGGEWTLEALKDLAFRVFRAPLEPELRDP